MIGKRKTARKGAVFFQFSTLSLLVGTFHTIVGVIARSTIHCLNTSVFSDFRRNANATIISRLYRSTMFPFRQRVRRQTCSSCSTPLLSITRIFACTAAVNTPNKSAIWLCVSHTPFVAGRIVTCPFSIVIGCIIIVGFFIGYSHFVVPHRVRACGLQTVFLIVSYLHPPFCPLHGHRFEWSSVVGVPSCG